MKTQCETVKNDMNVYFEMMQKSQRALKHSASSLFTVSSFYKEITELFNHIENSEAEVKKDEIEKLMDIVEDFIESKEYNTDILETCIRDNEEFLIKYENLFGLSLRNESIEEIPIDLESETPALQEAEDILKQARSITLNKTQNITSANRGSISSMSQKAKSMTRRAISPQRVTIDPFENDSDCGAIKLSESKMSKYTNPPNLEFSKLEAIVEKDLEEKDEFMVKWNRYTNLVQTAVNDRKHKDVLMKAINKTFPKTIDFMKIRLNNNDLNYEHDIIQRFEKSIFKTIENLFEVKKDLEKDIDAYKQQVADKNKEISTMKDILNTDHSLDRMRSSFEQLSNMILSKNFTSKLDSKAVSWLRSLYGDKLYLQLKEQNIGKKSRSPRRYKKKARKKFIEEYKLLLSEILDTITGIIDENYQNKAQFMDKLVNLSQFEHKERDFSNSVKYTSHETENSITINKLEYLKVKITEVLISKDLNMSLRTSKSKESLFDDTINSPVAGDRVDSRLDSSDIKTNRSVDFSKSRLNTFNNRTRTLKGKSFDNFYKNIDTEYEEPQSLNINSEINLKPIKFSLEDDNDQNLQKIKELEFELQKLRACERELSKKNYTIKTLKEIINKSNRIKPESILNESDLSALLKAQAKIIENMEQTRVEIFDSDTMQIDSESNNF